MYIYIICISPLVYYILNETRLKTCLENMCELKRSTPPQFGASRSSTIDDRSFSPQHPLLSGAETRIYNIYIYFSLSHSLSRRNMQQMTDITLVISRESFVVKNSSRLLILSNFQEIVQSIPINYNLNYRVRNSKTSSDYLDFISFFKFNYFGRCSYNSEKNC